MWLRENTQPNTEVKQREKDRGTRQRRDNEHRRPERYKVMNAAGSAPGNEQKFMDFLVGQQMCLLETDFAGCVVFYYYLLFCVVTFQAVRAKTHEDPLLWEIQNIPVISDYNLCL